MPRSDDRRVVIITGANEGLGYHMLTALLDDGYRVAGLDVAGDNLETLASEHAERVLVYQGDVTDETAVEGTVGDVLDQWGQIDILVNNAAVFTYGPFSAQSIEAIRREFEVNYFGAVGTIRAVLPHMRARNDGIVHNVSSGAGLVGHPGLSGYAATKGAIEALTRSLRLELRAENVACTVMHPALANTRSAARIGYLEALLSDPAVVGRKLANKIESRDRVIVSDWQTKLGLWLATRFPRLVDIGTDRLLDLEFDPPPPDS